MAFRHLCDGELKERGHCQGQGKDEVGRDSPLTKSELIPRSRVTTHECNNPLLSSNSPFPSSPMLAHWVPRSTMGQAPGLSRQGEGS